MGRSVGGARGRGAVGGSVASERSVGCESNGRDGKKRFDFTRKMMEGEIMIVFFVCFVGLLVFFVY